jgi:hypothetical protein
MRHAAFPDGLTRDQLIDWYRHCRRITRDIFTIPSAEAYHDQPIPLRNPIVFYEGHIPVFAVNTLSKLALKREGIDGEMETLFARGIDPESEEATPAPPVVWPAREDIQAYGRDADDLILRAMCDGPIDDGAEPQTRNAEAAFTIIEHEQMHQETLLYLFHQLPYDRKNPIAPLCGNGSSWRTEVVKDMVRIPAGEATLGASGTDFGWDNELPEVRVAVDEFSIDRHDVTNGDYLEFIAATKTRPPHFWIERDGAWQWRGLFELIPLPLDAPVYVTHDEADAYAAWRGERLMATSVCSRGAMPCSTPSAATSDSRTGIRCRSGRIRVARAHGACTTSSATAGSGRRRSSTASRASRRCPPIRSTRPTSSTASTT